MLIINEFKYCYLRKQLFIHLLMFFHQNNRYRLYSNRFAHKSVSLSYVCLNHRFRHIRGMRVTIRRGSNLTFAVAATGFFLGGGKKPAREACPDFEARIFFKFSPLQNSFRPPQQAIFGGGKMSLGGGAKTQKKNCASRKIWTRFAC